MPRVSVSDFTVFFFTTVESGQRGQRKDTAGTLSSVCLVQRKRLQHKMLKRGGSAQTLAKVVQEAESVRVGIEALNQVTVRYSSEA